MVILLVFKLIFAIIIFFCLMNFFIIIEYMSSLKHKKILQTAFILKTISLLLSAVLTIFLVLTYFEIINLDEMFRSRGINIWGTKDNVSNLSLVIILMFLILIFNHLFYFGLTFVGKIIDRRKGKISR